MSTKKLERSTSNRWFGGVCGGIAEYTGAEAGLIRFIVAVGTLLGFGSLFVAYVLAWVIMPKRTEPARTTIVHEPVPPSA
ncbi:PspC domain-containing protein [Aeromicrobium terrae]|uniref:PspC domain-containing protein n=1 Tax=Aeromicrobium terrae TaxID=2498846 RepID=A0A5C8NF92_9ACTN|nr:PspC domain-containing protein [Aeromicrobium terrae]TXL57250.1 PspC domain-containing protein [Aeromicrobium terrae]